MCSFFTLLIYSLVKFISHYCLYNIIVNHWTITRQYMATVIIMNCDIHNYVFYIQCYFFIISCSFSCITIITPAERALHNT